MSMWMLWSVHSWCVNFPVNVRQAISVWTADQTDRKDHSCWGSHDVNVDVVVGAQTEGGLSLQPRRPRSLQGIMHSVEVLRPQLVDHREAA